MENQSIPKNINEITWKVFKHRSILIEIDENHQKTMKSFDVLLKTPWFSSPCEWFRFAFQRSLKSFKMTPWSQLAPKVHLRRKVKYWKCHFLSALHFPEIEGSRFRTSRLQRLSLKSVIFLEGKGWEEKAWRWRRSQRLTSLILKTLHLP